MCAEDKRDALNRPDRKISVIEDLDGKKIVVINDILFKGKRSIDWDEVEQYLRRFVGESYIVAETADIIYIGTDLPDEYAHSEYTRILKGANAKAKANAIQGIPEMIEIATKRIFRNNSKKKHKRDAQYGWYRYESRFGLPVYDNSGEIERFNVFRATMVVRHNSDGRLYLYEIVDIKKETSNLFES